MATITTNLSWSGSWSRLYDDISKQTLDNNVISSDAVSSSEQTTIADADTVVLSQQAQQSSDVEDETDNNGLGVVSQIYTAAAAVINSSSSSDQDKVAAYGAALQMTSLSEPSTMQSASDDTSSYGYEFEMLAEGFQNAIAGSSFMKTVVDTLQLGSLPGNASDLQAGIYDIYYDIGHEAMYGVNSLSINVQESTTQSASGETTTSYSFSYMQGKETQSGTTDFGGLVDPLSAFSGVRVTAQQKPTIAQGGETTDSSYDVASPEVANKNPILFGNSQDKLGQEIVNELFGLSDIKNKNDISNREGKYDQKSNQIGTVDPSVS